MSDKPEPKKPEWKVSRHILDEQRNKKVQESTVAEAFPVQRHRLGRLKDPDEDLGKLLDYFESRGVPMGSDRWTYFALIRMIRDKSDIDALNRLLREDAEGKKTDLDALRRQLRHNLEMFRKHYPSQTYKCDWCGHEETARPIGGGCAACFDCLPEKGKGDD